MIRAPTAIDLELRPTLEIVPIVRRFVELYFERAIADVDAASRMALAAHELLENTAKYAIDGRATMRLVSEPAAGHTLLSIRTVNRAIERDRANVIALLGELVVSLDAAERYQEIMRQSARRRQGSGLGLARVWVEAEMPISYSVAGDAITLEATAKLVDGPREVRLPTTVSAEFGATPSYIDGVFTVKMTGSADASATAAIERLLPRIHDEILRLGLNEVVVDITGLGLMTSSCFRSFVSWITNVADLPTERQYKIRLRGSPGVLWQRRSLHALKRFGDALVEIEGMAPHPQGDGAR